MKSDSWDAEDLCIFFPIAIIFGFGVLVNIVTDHRQNEYEACMKDSTRNQIVEEEDWRWADKDTGRFKTICKRDDEGGGMFVGGLIGMMMLGPFGAVVGGTTGAVLDPNDIQTCERVPVTESVKETYTVRYQCERRIKDELNR